MGWRAATGVPAERRILPAASRASGARRACRCARPNNAAMGRRLRGFSLLECLVALALGGICLVFALPAWRDSLQAQRVRAACEVLNDALRLARLDARAHARDVRLCPSRDGRACDSQARWEQGWVTLAAPGSPDEMTLAVQGALAGVRIDASAPLAHGAGFDAAGWPRQPAGALLMGRWRVCPLRASARRPDGRELVMAASGRVREQPVNCGPRS